MRLLDTKTYGIFEPHADRQMPSYAILSHVWKPGEEVSFQEMQEPTPEVQGKSGYLKIKWSASEAVKLGFDYIWVDTCCINKESSAELSEAINSMYQYYQDAKICLVYLDDVKSGEDPHSKGSNFCRSRWFTRGWTLQELLAPLSVAFYACDGTHIGTKSTLQNAITRVTGVPTPVLIKQGNLKISVAQRMSWAAKRQTTKEEDKAYCLMGLFGINMPILYGEGMKAFTRLQYEIMKTTGDESIFAWEGDRKLVRSGSLVAGSPTYFEHSASVESHDYVTTKTDFTLDKGRVRIQLPLIPRSRDTFLAILNCRSQNSPLGIILKKSENSTDEYVRSGRIVLAHEIAASRILNFDLKEVFVREKDPVDFTAGLPPLPDHGSFDFRGIEELAENDFVLRDVHNFDITTPHLDKPHLENHMLRFKCRSADVSMLMLMTFVHNKTEKKALGVILGFHNNQVFLDIVRISRHSLNEIYECYQDSGKRASHRNAHPDSVSTSLHNGHLVRVQVFGERYQYDERGMELTVVISVHPSLDTTSDSRLRLRHSAYVYAVKPPPTRNGTGFTLKEVYPKDYWDTGSQLCHLSIEHVGSCGIAMFQENGATEHFFVVLGIHNNDPWMEVVIGKDIGPESMNRIWKSFREDSQRGLMSKKLELTAKLRSGRTVRVHTQVHRPEGLGGDERAVTRIEVQ